MKTQRKQLKESIELLHQLWPENQEFLGKDKDKENYYPN